MRDSFIIKRFSAEKTVGRKIGVRFKIHVLQHFIGNLQAWTVQSEDKRMVRRRLNSTLEKSP